MAPSTVSVVEIGSDDVQAVATFLHRCLNPRVAPSQWAVLMQPPWGRTGPNLGFRLVDASGQTVGAYVAVYSTRKDGAHAVCNLAAFCVVEEHRAHALRLLRALLRQKGFLFTDLSPSGNVPALNERLGFQRLDTSTRLVLTLPHVSRRHVVSRDHRVIADTLVGRDAEVFRDHRSAPAAHHLLVRADGGHAYLMYRRDRRKRLPLFASPIYCGGDTRVLQDAWGAVGGHLLRQGLFAVLAERRVLGFVPAGAGRDLKHPRVKMFRGEVPTDAAVDYLYSEMTLLQW